MRLLLVELRRGWVRRSTRVLVLVAVLMIAALGIGMFLTSSADLDESARMGLQEREQQLEQCIDTGGFGSEVPESELPALCESMVGPVDWFVSDQRFHLVDLWMPPSEDGFDEGGDGILTVTTFLLVLGALIAGATFVGADWRYGTIGTLLTWEPRRGRVFSAKAVAVAIWSFALGVVLQALVCLSVLPAALWRGTTEGADGQWFGEVVAAILRSSALAAGAALLGYAVASLGRNTAAALGAAFGYVAVGESLLRMLRPGWQQWLLGDNTTTVIVGTPLDGTVGRSVGGAALVLTCYLAGALLVAAVVFARRDVAS